MLEIERMSMSKGLRYLGFKPDIDFVLQDDGAGAYIRDWNSSEPKPSEADIEAAYDSDYSRKRREAYDAAGCTIDALAIATFESVFADDSSAAVKLQIEREKIKAAIPKP